jgi:hypothetical protein
LNVRPNIRLKYSAEGPARTSGSNVVPERSPERTARTGCANAEGERKRQMGIVRVDAKPQTFAAA